MKPIAIFRHSPTEGAGHFASFLDARARPWQLIAVDEGAAIPTDARAFAGLVFMGGPMSVNDDLPWIPRVLDLIRAAVAADIPVLGHCLGGQLMSKALGGAVGRNPVKEIGWGRVSVADTPLARGWFGDITGFESFHWHGETFSLPAGAERILSSAYCENQAFALGPHLGMQCHVEMTPEMIETWSKAGAGEIAAADSPAVQSAEEMRALIPSHLAQLHRVAERLYSQWLRGLAD